MNNSTIELVAQRPIGFASLIVILQLAALMLLPAVSNTANAGNFAQSQNCVPSLQLRPTCDALLSIQIDTARAPVPALSDHSLDVISGNAYQFELDYKSMASGLELTRHYNSSLTDYEHSLGAGWNHNFAISLFQVSDVQVDITQANGRVIAFYRSTSPLTLGESKMPDSILYTPASGYDGYLEAGSDTIWRLPDGRTLFFDDLSENGKGQLKKVDFGDHLGVLELTYNDSRLQRVVDRRGDSLTFNYGVVTAPQPGSKSDDSTDSNLLITSIAMPNGHQITYNYDSAANLASVMYSENSGIVYEYGDDNWPNHLTKRQLVNNGPMTEWRYDKSGRAIAWSAGHGTDSIEIERTFTSQGSTTDSLPDDTAQKSIDTSTAAGTATAIVANAKGHKTQYSWNYQVENDTSHTVTNIACGNCQLDFLPRHGSQEYEQMMQALASQHPSSFFKLGNSVPPLWESLVSHTNSESLDSMNAIFAGEFPHPEGNVPVQIIANRQGEIVDIKHQGGSFLNAAQRTLQEQIPRCYERKHFQDVDSMVRDRLKTLGTENEGCQEDSMLYLQIKKELEFLVKPIGF